MNETLRVEQKYLITYDQFRRYSHYFSQLLTEDKHNTENGYSVRSLYFDTAYDKDYHDKLNGVEIRQKLRLRTYSSNAEFAMLELKQKQGNNQRKRSLQLLRSDAEKITNGDYSSLLSQNNNFAVECYNLISCEMYRPKTIIEYNRRAFVTSENKTRITFDSDIRACESIDLFSENLPLTPVLDPFLAVLEVKYTGFLLSYIQETINNINKSTESVSKYCLGRERLI